MWSHTARAATTDRLKKRSLTLPDTILKDPQTHACYLACSYTNASESEQMYVWLIQYIHMYIYTHTANVRPEIQQKCTVSTLPYHHLISFISFIKLFGSIHPCLSKDIWKNPLGCRNVPPISCNLPTPTRSKSASLSPLSCGDKNCKARPCLCGGFVGKSQRLYG